MNNLVEAALSYAGKGYHVFPCKPRSKEPATKHGFKDATRDQETVRRWWSENPNYNIAIATGKESGLWVLDVDGEEGRESYLKYQSNIPYDTPTATIRTIDLARVGGRSWGYESLFTRPTPEGS
jgi:hypothetical protein